MVKDRLGRRIPKKKLIQQQKEMEQNAHNMKYYLLGCAIAAVFMGIIIYIAY